MHEIDELLRRARKGMDLGLEPTRRALALLGRPDTAYPVVHVAGSNGKGSVCAMVESIALAAGVSVGLTTSPHLCRFAERIRVNGAPLTDVELRRALSAVLACEVPLTFFESLTVAAFVAFRDAGVELGILEVGLGGRLDATNVVEAPLVTAVTSIALEHTAILGSTIEAIAREKAGILKRGAPVVLGPLEAAADAVMSDVAAAVGAGPILRPEALEASAPLGLRGPHQRANAGVAAAIARELASRWPRIAAAIPEGLARASWPGRFERISAKGPAGDVEVVLDGAHNPHGARALGRTLDEESLRPDRTILVFGALADKAFPEMLTELAPRAHRRVYATPEGRAPAPLGDLARIAAGEEVGDPRAALARALELAARGDTILVTGSIYLVGAVRGALLGLTCDAVVGL